MKKITKIILLLSAVAILIAAGIGLYLAAPYLAMRPAKTGEIPGTGIYAIRNKIGALYLIETAGDYIMIDAGSDAGAVEVSLKEAGIAPEDVKWILLTHSDFDHVAALVLFPNAEIYMNEDERGLLDGTISRSEGSYNSLPDGIAIDSIQLLQDEQELLLGGVKVGCFKAPGHTDGSMAYLVDDTYLFTGDAFRLRGNQMRLHPFTMDAARAEASVKRLKGLPHSMILTSHYGYSTII